MTSDARRRASGSARSDDAVAGGDSQSLPPFASIDGNAIVLRVKAVPGASRDAIAGPLGDRLKVRVAAPPEGGRANEAIVRLLAEALGVPIAAIAIVQGHAAPLKVVRVEMPGPAAGERLGASPFA